MLRDLILKCLLVLCCIICFVRIGYSKASIKQKHTSTETADFRNFYGIAWRGKAHDNLAYAKQMGYDYVFYQKGMEKDSLSNGLYFYIETPENSIFNAILDTKKAYSPDEIDFYETRCSLKNMQAPFPFNIATGWCWLPDSSKFEVLLDFQQQKVISWAIDSILTYAKSIESRNPKFHFGGFGWDEPRPSGDFWDVANGKLRAASLKNWNGDDAGFTHNGIVHEYSTYTDGHMEFYKQLYKATRLQYPGAKFMSEPYNIYDAWIKLIEDRADAKEITPDILSQEGPGTQFVDDARIFTSGLISKENIFCTTPNVFDDENNRTIMAKAAINGAWFAWFGRFGGTGNMPDYKNITEVPPRLQLIRMLANWENRNGTPLSERLWNRSVYQSKNAFASRDVIWALQPNTNKLFVVFLTQQGSVPLEKEKKVTSIARTDNLFIENGNGKDDIKMIQNSIRPVNTSCLNKGYIVSIN